MSEAPESNRRDFLSGKAAQKLIQQQRDQMLDNMLEPEAIPVSSETIRLETRAMGCQWGIVLNPSPPEMVMTASDCFDLVHEDEELLTIYRETSEVSRLNRTAAEREQSVSPQLFQFLQACRDYWIETEGAFDPAAGALIQLWREMRKEGTLPSQQAIDEALQQSGMKHVRLNSDRLAVFFETPGLKLDFASIGKGYAVDRIAESLQAAGVHDFLIHGGLSSLKGSGNHGGYAGWPVGIKNPLFTDKRYATLLLKNEGMSTSGSNIQYFRHDGKRYGHLLDPRAGWPANELLSVTVIAESATRAEALSTAFYAMGLDKAEAYCDDHPEISAILIPPPSRGGTLEPVVKNFPLERIFFEHVTSITG